MQFFLVGTDREGDRGLERLAAEISGAKPARLIDLEALRADARFHAATRALVLLPLAADDPAAVDAAIAFAAEIGEHAFVACFADTIAPDRYKRLLRTGRAEWIGWDDYAADFRELAARLNAATPRGSGDAARIVSFLPSKGGVGNSTLAVETGYALAMQARGRTKRGQRGRVAILDLNLQGGTVADALDVEPRFDMAQVMQRPERLDEHLVDIFASRHEASGLDAFACPPSRLDLNALTPDLVFTVIDAVATRYDVLILDLPTLWLTWTEHLLHGSDGIVVTGNESVPALRRLKATLGGVDATGIASDKVAVAVNEVATDLLGRPAGRATVEKALTGRTTFLLRRDDEAVRTALDAGRPVSELAGSGRLARDLKPLTAWVAGFVARQQADPDKAARAAA